ncbi:HTH-type transcriptional regulator BetI [bacterium HR36]|uniref:Transcriptional regulator n=1 Tax=uncultured Planctomycetota bacterium TaxID=120965 RepID=H5SCY4_9BACT|nr:transcriptional regulator [uncultured Planctomycetota bacterium]GBD37127.1 HTH-type transcriptional regulator BetI [bacterium HR36]
MHIITRKSPREHILETAGKLFAERGYEAVSVREICRRARVNISAVNYYFRDKQNLYLEAVRTAARQRSHAVPLVTWSERDPPATKLCHFIHNMLLRVVLDRTPDWHAQLIVSEIVRPTRVCRRFVREFIRPNFELLLEILRELVGRRCSSQQLHRLAFSIVGQCMYYRMCRSVIRSLLGKASRPLLDIKTLARHITEFSLAGISKTVPSTRRQPLAMPALLPRRSNYALDSVPDANRRPR